MHRQLFVFTIPFASFRSGSRLLCAGGHVMLAPSPTEGGSPLWHAHSKCATCCKGEMLACRAAALWYEYGEENEKAARYSAITAFSNIQLLGSPWCPHERLSAEHGNKYRRTAASLFRVPSTIGENVRLFPLTACWVACKAALSLDAVSLVPFGRLRVVLRICKQAVVCTRAYGIGA